MKAADKPKMGRPPKDATTHKRPRSLSMTDAEYEKLNSLATAAGLSTSEYVIDRLGLSA